jgi:hypothetical protein
MMIRAVRTESRGLIGSLAGEKLLVIQTGSEHIHKYLCKKEDCLQLKKIIDGKLALRSSIEKLEDEILRQLKPVAEMDLREVAGTKAVRELVVRILDRTRYPFLTKETFLREVIQRVQHLISGGLLDGVVTSSWIYKSNISK